jgi:hypothetical protein
MPGRQRPLMANTAQCVPRLVLFQRAPRSRPYHQQPLDAQKVLPKIPLGSRILLCQKNQFYGNEKHSGLNK